MYKAIFYTHLISVNIFLLVYLYKTFLLLTNKNDALAKFTKSTKVVEMIISTLFLLTGIYMLTQIPEINTMLIIKIVMVFLSIPIAIIGFKKGIKAMALSSLLLIIGAYGLAEMSKMKKPATTETRGEGVSANGHDLFVANCVSCHGEDGKLGLMDSPDLSVSSKTLDEKIAVIKNGKGAMTPFASALTDEQIKAVAEFTETLKH